jgi:hypothetical protein
MSTTDKQNADKLLLEKIKAISHSANEASAIEIGSPHRDRLPTAVASQEINQLNLSVLLPGEQLKLNPSHITVPSSILPAEEYNSIFEVIKTI